MVAEHVHSVFHYQQQLGRGPDGICDGCRRAATKAHKQYMIRRQVGTLDVMVRDAKRIDNLKRRVKVAKKKTGMSHNMIARAAGINKTTIKRLMLPGTAPEAMRTSTVEKLERYLDTLKYGGTAVSRRVAKYAGRVDKELAVLAIRGLMLRGWSTDWIAEQVGAKSSYLRDLGAADSASRAVSVELDRKLTELARRYGTTDGPSWRTAAVARKLGYKSTVERDEFL